MMQHELERILTLQRQWSSRNTRAMQERGLLVRDVCPGWIRSQIPLLRGLFPSGQSELDSEGRDGAGAKTQLPWVRLFNRSMSPSAAHGWYLVYLFGARGDAAYLSLNQGTTSWSGGNYVPVPPDLLRARVEWARSRIDLSEADVPLELTLDLGGSTRLGPGYERGNVAAIRYPEAAIPDEAVLASHLEVMCRLLSELYRVLEHAEQPGEESASVTLAEQRIDELAGRRWQRSLPFRPNARQRRAIELRAMRVARAALEAQGWATIEDTSAHRPYDFHVRNGGDAELFVEVKGTTSDGSTVLLTRNEADYAHSHCPATALYVVSDVRLGGTPDDPEASGGHLRVIDAWDPYENTPEPIAFRYELPVER